MNKKSLSVLIALSVVTSTLLFSTTKVLASGTIPPIVTVAPPSTYGVTYNAHVQNIGWQTPAITVVGEKADFATNTLIAAGTEGRGLRVEGLRITGNDLPDNAKITYRAQVQNKGWMAPVTVDNKTVVGSAQVGTAGEGLRMESLKITLSGLPGYAVKYEAHVQNKAWMSPITVENGTAVDSAVEAGTTGKSLRMEALKIEIVKTDAEKALEVVAINAVAKAETTNESADITSATLAVHAVASNAENIILTKRISQITFVQSVSVTDATTVTFSSNAAPTAVTWNGTDVKASLTGSNPYTIKVPNITKTANNLVVSAVNHSAATVNYSIPVGTYGNLNVMDSAAELTSAIDAQANDQTWIIKAGTYDLPQNMTTLRDESGKVVTTGGQAGWYLPLAASNLTIIGENNPILTSTTSSENGAWASQNFVTVFGDSVKISGVTLKTKEEANKVIEVVGDNFVLDNAIIEPNTYNFAGSIYFSNPGKTATISNTLLNYGRIGGLTGATEATINLTNDQINFAGAAYKDPAKDGNAEDDLWGYYRDNSNGTAAKVNATNLKVTMSNAMGTDLQDAINMLPSGTTVELAAGTYNVPNGFTVPYGVTLDKTKNNAIINVMPAGTVFVSNVTDFNAALSGSATSICMAAGTYKFDSQIRITKAINIIGAGDSTVITTGDAAWTNTTGSKGYAPLITVVSGDSNVTLQNIKVTGAKTIITTSFKDYGSGINVVSSTGVTLTNVTSTNNAAAGLIVNGSTVTAENLNTSNNGWYGVNVDKINANFTLTGMGVIAEPIQILCNDVKDDVITAAGYKSTPVATDVTSATWSNK